MTGVLQFFAVLLMAFGLVSLMWLAMGALLLPVSRAARMVVTGQGCGDGLEQTVRALLWLRRTGLWRGEIVIEDGGLNEDGMALARILAGEWGVLLSGDTPDRA